MYHDPNYQGSEYNVMVEGKNGEHTYKPLKIMAISEDPHHTQKSFLYKAMVRLWKCADYSHIRVQFFPASANVLSVLQISQTDAFFAKV